MAPTFPAVSKGGCTGRTWRSRGSTAGAQREGCLEKGASARDAAWRPLTTDGRRGRAWDGAGRVSRQPGRRRRFQRDGAWPAVWPLGSPAKWVTRKGRASCLGLVLVPSHLWNSPVACWPDMASLHRSFPVQEGSCRRAPR